MPSFLSLLSTSMHLVRQVISSFLQSSSDYAYHTLLTCYFTTTSHHLIHFPAACLPIGSSQPVLRWDMIM